ncbi:diphthamide biosynthesis protein 2 [Exophiala mesophila]|uniref:2-(3-amino-3-carboxypropyl)histidine synthase subunit 2 n=1 Tax=Exophiala mesophila TaxID=212818 RepID=A0A0D2A593_EXOME|nr:diphthamide biosynthesis protein 2 [Exophiala mesophila]KIV94183.1 diphthamide biosynthesis protein 2 [Exophiala mesophila]
MAGQINEAPILSTPESHILSETIDDVVLHPPDALTDDQIHTRYEIQRTLVEIRQQSWRRVALQFPDHMLPHSSRVFQMLSRGLRGANATQQFKEPVMPADTNIQGLSLQDNGPVKLTILGDTSYGSCCVDEVAAEHTDADAVIHYGRACLSPTARLPVLHIFTVMNLDHQDVISQFQGHFPDLGAKVILTADAPYATHVEPITQILVEAGYQSVFAASIVHDPSSSIPNRTVPSSVDEDATTLSEWHLFHISEPPTALLLTLTSRVASVKIFHTSNQASGRPDVDRPTQMLLRRRYALITSLSTVSTWGILINTLSVKNYLSILDHIRRLVSSAGKKSYLVVVGKLNPSKVANFSEIGGWVVIGCWESSLIDSKEFYRPVITPFELELALKSDEERVWTGQWRGDFQNVLESASKAVPRHAGRDDPRHASEERVGDDEDDDWESEPPEFDLRTGRYISRTRPMQSSRTVGSNPSSTVIKLQRSDLVTVNGVASPAAEYLSQQRTWRGLGSDMEVRYEESNVGNAIEEGRSGVARGYTVGESTRS